MESVRKVIKLGDSFAITIPANVVRELNLRKGDFVKVNFVTKVKMKFEEVM